MTSNAVVSVRIDTIRNTRNRAAIIRCLSEPNSDCGGYPPYSASDIEYMLEGHDWYGLKRPVSISQINRTLRDLLAAGLVDRESSIDDVNSGLPQRVWYYFIAGEKERNKMLHEIKGVLRTAEKCHGTFFFDATTYFDKPFTAKEKEVVIGDIKAMMQRTHPDKATGYEYQFKQLQQALVYCRSDIDLLKTPNKKLKVTTC